jgi:predicted phosphoribosyltransferase/dienelactone hydrolase
MQRALFRDRQDAGAKLAAALRPLRDHDILVLALPRGGVPVAAEVAKELEAELDVLVARKLGAPGHPEFGFGAIAPGGVRVLDDRSVELLDLTRQQIDRIEALEREEMMRRVERYRGGRPAPRIEGRTVIVIDDGVATGGTARAALRRVRAQRPANLVFAAPVGPIDARFALASEADRILLLATPDPFAAVGQWYDRFEQTSDDEVIALLEQAARKPPRPAAMTRAEEVRLPVDQVEVHASLTVPPDALGLVIFAHGSGSSRFSPRNQYVARVLHERGLATLLLDLLTEDEETVDLRTRELRFDIGLLASRLADAARWAQRHPALSGMPIGYFGSSTGGGAALVAATLHPEPIFAIVSRGGRPDLAGDALPLVEAPTLLLVGGSDDVVIDLNEQARARMTAPVELRIIPGATHLFEEPGTLEEVAGHAADWFARWFAPATARRQALARERTQGRGAGT